MTRKWWHHPENESYFFEYEENLGEGINAAHCHEVEISKVPSEFIAKTKSQLLIDWHESLNALEGAKNIVSAEMALRKEVADLFFPEPVEGTNKVEIGAGYQLKLTHKIDRKLDEAALEAVKVQLREMNINPDPLVSMKPSLDLKAYKGLMAVNVEAIKVFDQCLTIKPASPTMEIIQPKEVK